MIKTYSIKAFDRTLLVKASKVNAENLAGSLRKLAQIRQFHRELSGIIGGEEYSVIVSDLFGPSSPLENEEGFQRDVNALLNSLPELITGTLVETTAQRAEDLFKQYVAVIDKRTTAEQREIENQARAEANARYEAERQERIAAYVNEFCNGPEEIPIPEGYMAVYLELTYNGSDAMSDYYAPHCGIGVPMLLGLVQQQAQTERLARVVVARYSELVETDFKWHTENYRGGHGNYLMTTGTVGYDSRSDKRYSYEIQFDPYSRSMRAFRRYPGDVQGSSSILQPGSPSSPTTGAIVRRNMEHNGIEVQFAAKPGPETIALLKGNGFRWSFANRVWYTRFTEAKLEWAQAQFADTNASAAIVPDAHSADLKVNEEVS